MKFELNYTIESKKQLLALQNDRGKQTQYKAVGKVLAYMQVNLRHPFLNTHKFDEIISPFGGEVFESYAQNKTPGAYRIFWTYGPQKGYVTILAITPHP